MSDDRSSAAASLGDLAVVSFESRRSVEMAALLERHGARPIRAPSMREVPLEDGVAVGFAEALRAGEFDLVVLMTGVGTRALIAAIEPEMTREDFAARLAHTTVIARGPKPSAVLRELGLSGFLVAREPNTWREVLALVRTLNPPPRRVVIQEHGAPSDELVEALTADGCAVRSIAVYVWALPEDTGPLRAALRDIAEGRARVALFTSATQVTHALSVAREEGLEDAVREALARGVVASIGPICSDALRAAGLAPDIEPEHPKMGHLVKAVAMGARGVLARKDAA